MIAARAFTLARANVGAIWLLVATTAANVLSYVYQAVMARLLRPEEYAVLTAFLALLILEQLGGQAIQSGTAKLVAQYRARADAAALHAFVERWIARIALVAGVPALAFAGVALAVGRDPLSPLAIAAVSASLFLAAINTFTFGLLQGLARFGWFGSLFIAIAVVRLGVGVGLVTWLTAMPDPPASPVSGALIGSAVALAVSVAGSFVPLAPLFRASRRIVTEVDLGRGELRTFVLAAVAFLCYGALTFVDGLLAPWRIPDEAGPYAAAITMGKIVLFAPIAIGFILLERTAHADALGRDADRYLFRSLGFVLLTSGAVTAAYLVAPSFFSVLVVGTQYGGVASLAGAYGVAALSNACLSLWVAYFIGTGRAIIGPLLATAVVIEIGLVLLLANDAISMVRVVLATSLTTHACVIALYLLGARRPVTRRGAWPR